MSASSLLTLSFDFKGGGGFVVARRAYERAMPEDYVVEFRLRGHGPRNNLELKLVDASGHNVWRHVYKDFEPPRQWKRLRLRVRDIEFAWGPASGTPLTQLGSLEIAITAAEGGRGSLSIADLEIYDAAPRAAPRIVASSEQPGFEGFRALAGAIGDSSAQGAGSGWRPRPDDSAPWLAIDWAAPRSVGGFIIDWLGHAPRSGFRIRSSTTGKRWKTEYLAPAAGGHRSYVGLPDLETRYLRLELSQACAGASLRPQSFEFARSPNAFWQAVAAGEDRGWHPRWLQREQTQWTPIGTADGTPSALMNEDGMVEVAPGSWSVEPMLWAEGRLYTWNDVILHQALEAGWKPVPYSIWESRDWRLSIKASATVRGAIRLRYRLENRRDAPLTARIFLLIRPFQVTPPWQSFRRFGGVSPIKDLEWRDGAVRVGDGDVSLIPAEQPAGFGALRFDQGFMAAHLATGRLPDAKAVHDARGFACGALAFDVSLVAGEVRECELTAAREAAHAQEPDFEWGMERTSLWSGHGWIEDAIEAAHASTAFMEVTRAGPALQPGPRRYTRSWIRDGAMMGAALLRMGHDTPVRDFIRWYAPYQRADGFVPCCVDAEGPDWLVEHDSHGQLIALIGDYFRFTGDHALVQECWGHVERAARFIESIIEPQGLLPVSVSHEGYLAQPVHAFWDDFWAVKGLQEGAAMAAAIGREPDARRWQALAARLESALFAAIEDTRGKRGLAFVPGSIEWADFDPTATANALYLFDVPSGLDRSAIEHTFDRYLADWRSKRAGEGAWTNYTPYEIRIIGAMVRLGRREAALELLRFFLSDRRPLKWNQWPEIAWRDHRTPGHVGDLPHTWIAGEYVLAVRSLFAYEREASLVVAAGLAGEWLDGEGVTVSNMPTAQGPLNYTLRRVDAGRLHCRIGGNVRGPVVLMPPLDRPLESVTVDGRRHEDFNSQSVMLLQTPAEVTCTMAS